MYKKQIVNIESFFNNIINSNLKQDAVAYIQESDYITIIYEYNKVTKQQHMDNYPIKLLTTKMYDKLSNILNEKKININLKYILFRIENKDSINQFKYLNNIIKNAYNKNIEVDNYQVYYSLNKTTINPHYDRVDRYMIQVKGDKKVLLLEPKFIKDFNEYPLLHPANRNFQIKSVYDNDKIREHIKEFYLKEGDCLFIPKYWIHEISTNSESMSLVLTINNDIEKIHYYEIGKEIDSCLYQIGGMELIFKWNKLWLYNKGEEFILSSAIEETYHLINDYLVDKFPEDVNNENIKEIFHKHSESYKIFFDNDIKIPNY